MPGTAGFVSKWYLMLAALEKGQWWLVFLIVAVVAAGRRLRLALRRGGLLPRAAPDTADGACGALVDGACRPALLVAATVYFGLDTSFTVGSARAGRRAADGRAALMLAPEQAILAALAVPLAGAAC